MGSGKYRTRVHADVLQEIPDGAGGMVSDWQLVASFWAYVEPIGGREALKANQPIAEMDTRITARWTERLSTITAKHRLRVGADLYNIVRPPVDIRSRNREIEFTCNSGASDG